MIARTHASKLIALINKVTSRVKMTIPGLTRRHVLGCFPANRRFDIWVFEHVRLMRGNVLIRVADRSILLPSQATCEMLELFL